MPYFWKLVPAQVCNFPKYNNSFQLMLRRAEVSVRLLYMINDFLDPDTVNDRESFICFVQALIADQDEAERLEKSEPTRYQWGGANDW